MNQKKNCILFLLTVLLLTGCASHGGFSNPVGENEIDLAKPSIETPRSETQESEVSQKDNTEPDTESNVDVDLTQLSSTMVYSEVFQIMVSPESYIGKTMKISGQFAAYEGDSALSESDPYYFAVVISDATACCQQGIEFVLNGEHRYPDDYPPQETDITITGVFEAYMENSVTYYHIVTDAIEVSLP